MAFRFCILEKNKKTVPKQGGQKAPSMCVYFSLNSHPRGEQRFPPPLSGFTAGINKKTAQDSFTHTVIKYSTQTQITRLPY